MGRGTGALIFAAFVMIAPMMAQAACAPERILVQTLNARQEFSVEVADTEAERAQGLMNRPHMASAAGMLFVYDRAQRAQFWMANTLIPLDMIFAADDGTILKVHANAVPLDRSVIDGGDGVRYVLEINGGLAARLGIAAGGALHHPAIAGSDCALN
jgi:uncharacterized membrane protein (UPF0127 family)